MRADPWSRDRAGELHASRLLVSLPCECSLAGIPRFRVCLPKGHEEHTRNIRGTRPRGVNPARTASGSAMDCQHGHAALLSMTRPLLHAAISLSTSSDLASSSNPSPSPWSRPGNYPGVSPRAFMISFALRPFSSSPSPDPPSCTSTVPGLPLALISFPSPSFPSCSPNFFTFASISGH